jgi:hypothetical protein
MSGKMKINVADAAHTHVPRKQSPRTQPMSVSRTISNSDLERMLEKGVAQSVIAKLSQGLLAELTGYLRDSLVNAGPHVVDIKLTVTYDETEEKHYVTASTPCVPTKTYGAEVKREELSVAPKASVVVESPNASPWSILTSWMEPEIVYDGPRGEVDA